MRRDKRANHRYKIGRPRIGGTQLQELYCEQTVWLPSALLCWEMRISSLPNEGVAQLWVAWRRMVCGPRWLCRTTRIQVLWYKQRIWESGKTLRYYQFEENFNFQVWTGRLKPWRTQIHILNLSSCCFIFSGAVVRTTMSQGVWVFCTLQHNLYFFV